MPSTLSVSRGGVEVNKSVIVEEPPVPIVAYVVESERDEPVSVRVSDELPDGVDHSAIALHDDYDASAWRLSADGRLEYARELPPGGSATTAFFVVAGAAVAREFFVTPSIADVRPTTLVAQG